MRLRLRQIEIRNKKIRNEKLAHLLNSRFIKIIYPTKYIRQGPNHLHITIGHKPVENKHKEFIFQVSDKTKR